MVFVDTSALVKLYIAEEGSGALAARLAGEDVVVSTLAWAEAWATFARLHREGRLTEGAWSAVQTDFTADWGSTIRVPVDVALEPLIADLCLRRALRGADVVHLASALLLRREGLALAFAACDRCLIEAAAAEGLPTYDPCAAP